MHLRGDGKGYAFRLRTTSDFDGVSYQVLVQPPAREWTDVVVRFADFEPVFRGRRVSGHPPLDPGRIKTFGFLISQKQDGRFELDVGSIRGWVDPTKGRPDAAGSER